ncbi:MAG: SPFH domain-containing protein [Candidatus Wallbacteria bacterium]|nr:SPFH domain-containing protein [Candidatus Wallbacteria bacterium]
MTREKNVQALSGWGMLLLTLALFLSVPLWGYYASQTDSGMLVAVLVLSLVAALFFCTGFFTLQPNEAQILILFGSYCGTVRESGFHWVNPFKLTRREVPLNQPETLRSSHGATYTGFTTSKSMKLSLRTRNFECERLKVNDKRGNPIEIAAVVVWKIEDTAMAVFDVDDYENYVRVQSESAVRHLANSYPYDHMDDGEEVTLRGGGDEIANALQKELQDRLSKAGVHVEEARLTHLAYSPEIAQTMLRRQQAEAVIAARQKIVHGAVSMVEMALRELSEKKVLILDEERKAAMVSNLLVVLCGESETKPVINTGTLYQ